MKVFLITHAHTEQVASMATDTWNLSAQGRQQAEALNCAPIWDDIDRVVVSSEAKTWLTVAEIVAARKVPVWIDCRFDELRRGGWIENYGEQVAAVFASPHEAIGEWEAAGAVQQRAVAAIEDLQRRFAGETLAVVGHGLCLSVLRAELLGRKHVDFEAWQRLRFASYACFSLNPRRMIRDFELNSESVR